MKRRTLLAGLAGLAAATCLPTSAHAIPSSVLGQTMTLPLGKISTRTYFQGAAWAKSPVTGREYVFQLQARPTGPGDVEDTTVHRYELVSGKLTHLDSMVGKGWGHCQTLKVRISSADNPYVLLGWEVYDDDHLQTGTQVMRCRYLAGKTVDRNYADATRVETGSTYALPVDCPDWTVALRTTSGATETVTWYDEAELLAATPDQPATPKHAVTFPKAPDVLQGMCATGTYDRPDDVWRINGTTAGGVLYRYPAAGGPGSSLDVHDIITGSASEEPESVLRIGAELWVGKQVGPSSSRVLALRKVGTIG